MHRARPRPYPRIVLIAALLALVVPATIVNAADPLSHGVPAGAVPRGSLLGRGLASAKIAPRLQTAHGPVTAFVELAAPAAIDASISAAPAGKAASQKAAKTARAGTHVRAAAVVRDLQAMDPKTRQLYQTTDAVSGVAVVADAASLRAIAAGSDVVSISTIVPKRLANSSTAVLTRVINTWQSLGTLGANVKVGVVDSGIDYTHADFGGPGTRAAYDAIDPTDATGVFPTVKVAGGIDLVGNAYDAHSDDPAKYTPVPDDNPIDCDGHGTHVAGIAAGLGVNANGSTFTGNYSTLTANSLAAMRIGPGMAPKATLYAIKVFGCPSGGTAVVGAALDWSLDPNGDGDFSDHLDIVNLSLGSAYAAPDDPEAKIVAKVTQHGVLAVYAAGNEGDLYDIGTGGPESLDVANSEDARATVDQIQVTAPANVAGLKPGQVSFDFRYSGIDLTRPVVKMSQAGNLDGCDSFSAADAARVAGKFVWLEYDANDATRRCGSAARGDNAADAGAAGAIFTSPAETFPGGIFGTPRIPIFQLLGSATAQLRPALNAGTLVMRFRDDLLGSVDTFDAGLVDQLSDDSSRGTRSPGPKPDVAAPGSSVVSAMSGTGNSRITIGGTSMASPHAAGIAALLHGSHPTWTPAEIKAAIMDTANHSVYLGTGQTGPIMGPTRVGTGRVDALDALTTKVIAFDKASPAGVSVGFGIVEAAGPVTLDHTVTIKNKGTTSVSYKVSFKPISTVPGLTYELDKKNVTVAGGASVDVRVRLRIADPKKLRKTLDPTMTRTQDGEPREFVAEGTGLVILDATAGTSVDLRVAVYAAPKPVADITVPASIKIPGSGTGFLQLGGRGIDQGTAFDDGYLSLYSVFELGATSPQLPPCGAHKVSGCTVNDTAKGSDLRFVGAGTTAPAARAAGEPENAELIFGIATWSNWRTVGTNNFPFVDIDVNGDKKFDFETFLSTEEGTDLLFAYTVDLKTGDTVDIEYANDISADLDSNVFDTNVIVMPVYLDALGIDARKASKRITYQVAIDGYYQAPNDSVIDFVAPVSYDPLKPGLRVDSGDLSTIFVAEPGTGLDIVKDDGALKKDKSDSLLVLNLHNKSGSRAAVVKITN